MSAKTPRDILDEFVEEFYPDEEIQCCDGFDDCVIGIVQSFAGQPVLAYDKEAMIRKMMEGDEMSYEDASEYFEFNIAGAYVGPGTPVFIVRIHGLTEVP